MLKRRNVLKYEALTGLKSLLELSQYDQLSQTLKSLTIIFHDIVKHFEAEA